MKMLKDEPVLTAKETLNLRLADEIVTLKCSSELKAAKTTMLDQNNRIVNFSLCPLLKEPMK